MVYLDVTLYRFPMVVNEFNILTPSARQSWLKRIDAQFPSLPIEGIVIWASPLFPSRWWLIFSPSTRRRNVVAGLGQGELFAATPAFRTCQNVLAASIIKMMLGQFFRSRALLFYHLQCRTAVCLRNLLYFSLEVTSIMAGTFPSDLICSGSPNP